MRFKILSLLAAMVIVTACASDQQNDAESSGSGEATTTTTADTSGTQETSVAPSAVDEIVVGSERDFLINVGDRIFFDFDRSDIRADAQAALAKQAAWLLQFPSVTIQVEGHCDERGTREYNFSLAARRAQAVRDYLASRGISGDRMRVVSYGKERPVVACPEPGCWAQNRRAVTVLDGSAGS